jgi:hypothetical protein
MNKEYFEKWTDLAKKAQEPFQAIAELNAKTLKEFTFLKPGDLAQKKPEELLEQQIEQAVQNGHKALDYMQKSFQIMEKAMLSVVQEVKDKTEINK